MLNRRHLRIKVLQILYSFYQNGASKDLSHLQKELTISLERMYDMYLYLLLAFEQMVGAAENRIEDRRKKIRPTREDLNPNLRFVKNTVFAKVGKSTALQSLSKHRKVNWEGVEYQEMFKKMFLASTETENYCLYMLNEDPMFYNDVQFATHYFKESIANSTILQHFFEEQSIYWADDLDLCCSMVIKSLKSVGPESPFTPLPLFKENDDEAEFAHGLVAKTIQHDQEYEGLIAETASNWEKDRIAKMDMILLKMGIAELLNFPSIPISVTLNECIEISKFYSTPKSNIFINGILDNLVAKFKEEKRLFKTGRGLLS
ncbi:MAG: transcription antitermination protein NusB [Bacteroidetes bacterium]|nr:transcription antitermination protein NusB [Bacteroidota bacterium]MBM3423906.1 transcription antitermination protein NusB [Bacteroidota bacterium]